MLPRSVGSSRWCMDNDRLGCPGICQQDRLYPVGIEDLSPISRILTDSQIGISSQPRKHAFVQGAREKGRLSSTRVPLDWDYSPPVAPVARIPVNTRGIRQRQLCWDATSNTTGLQLQIHGTSVVVTTLHREGGDSARQCITHPHRQQEERWRSPTLT